MADSRSLHQRGPLHRLTPADAGWEHLHFAVERLGSGETLSSEVPAGSERALVQLSGSARLEVLEGPSWEHWGERADVFSGTADSAYLPPGSAYRLTAHSELTWATGQAPVDARRPCPTPPTRIAPAQVEVELRGRGNASRRIHHLLDSDFPACNLLVVEVYTPAGNWSSYPAHKHDVFDPPREMDLEEVYYYRLLGEGGFALQRLYGGGAGRDLVVVARDGDLVLVPDGYHPVAAAPGYPCYYLNMLASDGRPPRSMQPTDHPSQAWVRQTWEGQELDERVHNVHLSAKRGGEQ